MRKFANYAACILSFRQILTIMISSIEIRMVCVMKRKNTDQLLKELMDSNDLSRVLSDNSACFRKSDLPHGLQALFDQQDMSKSALAKASGRGNPESLAAGTPRAAVRSGQEGRGAAVRPEPQPDAAGDQRRAVHRRRRDTALTQYSKPERPAFRLGASAFSIARHRPGDLRRWSSSRSGRRTQWTPCSAA